MEPQGHPPPLPTQPLGQRGGVARPTKTLKGGAMRRNVLHVHQTIRKCESRIRGPRHDVKGRERMTAPCRSGTAMESGITVRGGRIARRGLIISSVSIHSVFDPVHAPASVCPA